MKDVSSGETGEQRVGSVEVEVVLHGVGRAEGGRVGDVTVSRGQKNLELGRGRERLVAVR